MKKKEKIFRGKEVEFKEYIVTFNYDNNKCSIRRKDNKVIDTNSEAFTREFNNIRRTEEYMYNYKLMNLKYKENTNGFTKKDNDSLFKFVKNSEILLSEFSIIVFCCSVVRSSEFLVIKYSKKSFNSSFDGLAILKLIHLEIKGFSIFSFLSPININLHSLL